MHHYKNVRWSRIKFYEGGRNDPASTYHTALREWTLRRAEGHHAQGWSLCSDLERRRPLVQTEGRSVVSSIRIIMSAESSEVGAVILPSTVTFGSSCQTGSLRVAHGNRLVHLAWFLHCSEQVVQTEKLYFPLNFVKRRRSSLRLGVQGRHRTLAQWDRARD